ncbi:MAG TPA: MFS transporter [Caulobacteraceae bacterium]
MTAAGEAGGTKPVSMRTVVAASSAGTAFEWYDFFIFGSLTTVISQTFFSSLNETAGFIAALALFGVGFAFRPLGAFIFGWIGDRTGRKGAFLITVSLMGGATFAIGLLPSYEKIGILAPILLILLRIIQGTALGGEYGGAAIYVAEHAPDDKRGWHTGWIQVSAAFGLIGALAAILLTRTALGEAAFNAWGWRIPFLLSAGLLGISIWMRLKLSESPAFQALKDAGEHAKAPFREAFGKWSNLKLVLLALFAILLAQGAVWYCAFFYTQVFLEKSLGVPKPTIDGLIALTVVLSAPLYVFFGWLSDKWGRKWVMLGGMVLSLAFLFPGFHLLERYANPALAEATARAPITVVADPARCSLQFDPVGKAVFTTSCDIAKAALTRAGIGYSNAAAPAGSLAEVRIGDVATVASVEGVAGKAEFQTRLNAALQQAGYPLAADPARMNLVGLFVVLMVFAVGATALYGPQASALVELFPTKVRYTGLSAPYHIGIGWVGGFLPVSAFAIATATGQTYAGLWYPFVFTLISVLVTFFLLPETKGRPLEHI